MASQLINRDSLHVQELSAIRTGNWMHQLPVRLANNGKCPGIRDGRGLEEVTPKRLLDRDWKRSRGFAPIPRDDLLRTAYTILVVTPLHSGILRPPLSVSPFRLLDRHWKRSRGFAPIPRDDLLRTACTILVVTPLHSGILRPPLSTSPFRLLCRSLGTLAPPRLSGSRKPGLIVRIYSLSYPRILSNLH